MQKNFFGVKTLGFSLLFEGCSWFCMVFWALFTRVLAWCSMLLCVTFNVGMRGVCACCHALREEKFQKKKAICPLYLLLPCCGQVWTVAVEHANADCL